MSCPEEVVIVADCKETVLEVTNVDDFVVEPITKDITVEAPVQAIEAVVVQETQEVIIEPQGVDLVVRPVNKDLFVLPQRTLITLDGDTTNFMIEGEAVVYDKAPALEAMTQFTLVVRTPTGYEPADANNVNHFKYACGFLLTSVLAGETATTLLDGKIENPLWSFTVGDPLFMSTTPGTVVVIPDNAGEFFRQVAWTLSSTKLLVNQYEGTLNL